jgi:hypothetical protein
MSASLQPDWQVAEHEPSAEDHAGAAAGHAGMAAHHASQAELHNRSAMVAAQDAQEAHGRAQAAHDGTAQQVTAMVAHMDAWRQHIEAVATQAEQHMQAAMAAANHATGQAGQMAGMLDMQRETLAAFQAIAEALRGGGRPQQEGSAADGMDGEPR